MTERETCRLIAAADLGWLAMMALWSGQQVTAAEALGVTAEDMQPAQPGDMYGILTECLALNLDDMAERTGASVENLSAVRILPMGPTWMYPTVVMF